MITAQIEHQMITKHLEERAKSLGKELRFVDTQKIELKEIDYMQLDLDLVDASIQDAILAVHSPRIKAGLQRFLDGATTCEKIQFLTSDEPCILRSKDIISTGVMCEEICFTICTIIGDGGAAFPSGPDSHADKCYQKCKQLCI